jgi:hypothetical protein
MMLVGAAAMTVDARLANACSCVIGLTPTDRFASATAVFEGRALTIKREGPLTRGGAFRLYTEFGVTQVWKGQVTPRYRVWSWQGGAACGVRFDVGQDYFVYVLHEDDGRAFTRHTMGCGIAVPTSAQRRAEHGTPQVTGGVCPSLTGQVPPSVVSAALERPFDLFGWCELADPGKPPGPMNPPRTWLSTAVEGRPYDPAGNRLVWKAGCR